MKICVQVLAYNVSRFLVPMLNNVGPHVDRIYIAWSRLPYSAYNPEARDRYVNPTPRDLYKESRYAHKVVFVEGDWKDETDQRNELVSMARKDGYDLMLIQDADEFVSAEDYAKNFKFIEEHPEAPAFKIRWYVYWKTMEYRFRGMSSDFLETSACFALRLTPEAGFKQRRTSTVDYDTILPGLCHHLAFVYTSEGVYEKLSTWSHSADFDVDVWYELKWKYWNPSVIFLHPLWAPLWYKAVRHNDTLPPEMAEIEMPKVEMLKAPLAVRWRSLRYNAYHGSLYFWRWIKRMLVQVMPFLARRR